MTDPMPTEGLHDSIPEQDYHADPASLSSTGAKTLITDGPRAFQWTKTHPVHRDVYDLGSVVHALVLGVGDYDVLDFPDWRTKAAQAARTESREAGRTPILPRDMAPAEAMRDAVYSSPLAASILSEGRPEVSMWAEDPTTGVIMRGRADWLRPGTLVDFKTAAGKVDPAEWAWTVRKRQYVFQLAWYRRILSLNGITDASPLWLVVSKDAPHEVYVHQPDPALMSDADFDVDRALTLYAQCIADDVWPGLADDQAIHTITDPRWTA